MKKRKIAVGVIVAFLIIALAVSYSLGYFSSVERHSVGGETDERGCLTGAGYSWDNDVGACTRNWELNEEQKKAVKIAVAPLSYSVTVINVVTLRCGEGCYEVELQRNDNRETFHIVLMNWKISDSEEKNYCSEEDRAGDFCIELYAPVCGIFSDGTSKTFSNSCFACKEEIEYWISGEC
jgi:hypothetical protein